MSSSTQPELARRLTGPVPRYTSYPTANQMQESFDRTAHAAALAAANGRGAERPLSLYVHLPYCPSLCHYCGCHVVVTRQRDKMARYVDVLLEEMRMVADALPDRRRVAQLHFGGGTPNAMPERSLWRVLEAIRARFDLVETAELAIEVDPRRVVPLQLGALAAMGFNRMSFGVQDIDPAVQACIGRDQTEAQTTAAVAGARAAGVQGINVDLVYGLPHQTIASIEATVASIVSLRVDRVALFGFAYLPEARPNQRKLDVSSLPDTRARLDLEATARRRFRDAGYVAIGMDHFALPHDALAQARAHGHLHRTFQGYTPHLPTDTIGLGVSAVSSFRDAMTQNARRLRNYRAAIRSGRFAAERGLSMSADDRQRGAIIERLMCDGAFRWSDIAPNATDALWDTYPEAHRRLERLVVDDLVVVTANGVEVTERGFPYLRVIASAFDRYLDPAPKRRIHAAI